MIFDVTQIFSGKLNEDIYLFTIKAREKNTLYCTDIGTVIINAKTGCILTSIDDVMNKYIEKKHLDTAVMICKELLIKIQNVLYQQ